MQFPPHIHMQVTTSPDDNPVDTKSLGSRADTLKVFMQRPPDIRHLQVAFPVNTLMLKHLDDSAN